MFPLQNNELEHLISYFQSPSDSPLLSLATNENLGEFILEN
jgi:hypothetical protein